MLHEEDVSILERMLGAYSPVLSDEFDREYAIRARMAHAAGQTGPLGIFCLIDLCRSLGLGDTAREPPPIGSAWRDLPQDGKVEMEALYDGTWRPGKFLGFVAAGTLGVRLDGDPMVREVPAHQARLPAKSVDTMSIPDEDDQPSHARAFDADQSL